MDLGATICKRSQPICNNCPLQSNCDSFKKNLTKEIPVSKPKKTLPTKEIYLLVLDCNNSYLFKKKPSKGIWAGLWSMPELENFANTPNWIKENLCEGNFKILKSVYTRLHLHTINSIFIFNIYRWIRWSFLELIITNGLRKII
jgi:A/G-specific adenine glycosylase